MGDLFLDEEKYYTESHELEGDANDLSLKELDEDCHYTSMRYIQAYFDSVSLAEASSVCPRCFDNNIPECPTCCLPYSETRKYLYNNS